MPRIGDRVAHFDFQRAFDVGGHVTGFADLELVADVWLGIEAAHLFHLDMLA